MKFNPLCKTLTEQRANELIKELGFLGICDLLDQLATRIDGAVSLESDRVTCKIRTRKAGDARRHKRELARRGADK